MDTKLLKELYLIHAPSNNENEISIFVQNELKKMKIEFQVDEFDQIYSIKKNTPLLVAHLDQVGRKPISRTFEKKGFIYGNGNLGADDKNGVFIILETLKKNKNISFIFSTCEEIGGNIFNIASIETPEDCLFALILDRKGSSDIIGKDNNYCTNAFQKAILKIGKKYGYRSAHGIFSDADYLSGFLSCVNLSVGYYNPHTNQEYTKIADVENCIKFIQEIIKRIWRKFQPVKKVKKSFQFSKYSQSSKYFNKKTKIDYDTELFDFEEQEDIIEKNNYEKYMNDYSFGIEIEGLDKFDNEGPLGQDDCTLNPNSMICSNCDRAIDINDLEEMNCPYCGSYLFILNERYY